MGKGVDEQTRWLVEDGRQTTLEISFKAIGISIEDH